MFSASSNAQTWALISEAGFGSWSRSIAVECSARSARPPRFVAARDLAASTRIRRMTRAHTAKKCARSVQSRFRASTRRRLWARDFTTRLTTDPAVDSYPVWSPDGRTIVFSSSRGAKQLANLYWVAADDSSEAHPLTTSNDRQLATSWHPSGKYLAFDQQISPQQWDLMVLPMEVSGSGWKAGTATRVMSKIAQRPTAVFSPDGRWLAYTSNESGRSEVFVRSFPGPGAQWQVSTSGGWVPTWSRRRNELVYLSLLPDSHLMV